LSDVVLYKCVVCGRSFTSIQALRGHMKAHRDVEFENFTVRLPKELCSRFKEVCRRHNTTTCQVIHSLIQVFLEGEKRGVVNLATPNPVVIQLVNYFGGAPRGRKKWELPRVEPLDRSCSLCDAPAQWEAMEYSGEKRLRLCKRHAWLRFQFPLFRRLD